MSDRTGRILWGLIAVCLVGGLVAVPVVGDGSEGEGVRASGGWVAYPGGGSATSVVTGTLEGDATATEGGDGAAPAATSVEPASGGAPGGSGGGVTPTTIAPRAPSAGAGSGAGGAPPAADAPATTAAPAAAPVEDLGPPTDPGPAAPPRPGSYRYKASDDRGERETSTRYEDKGTTPAERRQLVTIRGEGFDTDNDVAWRADGVYVLSTVITFGENKGTCDWNPDTLQLKLPLVKGATWESSSSCTMTGIGPTPIPLNRTLTGKVLELRRVRIAGRVLDVWAIEGTERLDGAGQVVDRAGITLFSPKHGLAVSSSGKVTSSQGTSDYRNEILNLDPE